MEIMSDSRWRSNRETYHTKGRRQRHHRPGPGKAGQNNRAKTKGEEQKTQKEEGYDESNQRQRKRP